MNVADRVVALTGAAGGLGAALAHELAGRGARLLLVDREEAPLHALARELAVPARVLALDVTAPDAGERLLADARAAGGAIEVLVNNAGLSDFRAFADSDPVRLRALLTVNVMAPLLLTRAVLDGMLARDEGWIVNVGSIFGSIGFPYFAAYSASKFALHGFSQALRRELRDTGVRVVYVAPRAIRTPMSDTYAAMADAVGMRRDAPADVARRIAGALAHERAETFLGFPECAFVRINALLARLVDGALSNQARVMGDFARAPVPAEEVRP